MFVVGPLLLQGAGSLNTLDSGPVVALMVASLVLSLWGFIELGCVPGTSGPNRYGIDPLLEGGA